MGFQVTLDGVVYRTDDLTIDEAGVLEKECGKTWLELNPIRTSIEFKATARLFLARDHDPDQVEKLLAGYTISDAMAAVVWVDDDLPRVFEEGLPKAEGEASTTTSSSSPGPRGNGHPTSPAANGSGISSSSSPPSTDAKVT